MTLHPTAFADQVNHFKITKVTTKGHGSRYFNILSSVLIQHLRDTVEAKQIQQFYDSMSTEKAEQQGDLIIYILCCLICIYETHTQIIGPNGFKLHDVVSAECVAAMGKTNAQKHFPNDWEKRIITGVVHVVEPETLSLQVRWNIIEGKKYFWSNASAGILSKIEANPGISRIEFMSFMSKFSVV